MEQGMFRYRLAAPTACNAVEQARHRCFTKALTTGYRGARHWSVCHRTVSKIELLDDVPDWFIAKQRQTDDQPNRTLGRQSPPANRHGSGLLQGFVDPCWIDQAGETLELMRCQLSRIVQ